MLGMIVLMMMPMVGLLFFFVLPLPTAVASYVAGCLVSLAMHHIMYRTAKRPVLTGWRGLVGRTAKVVRWQGKWGTVRCHDELWTATSTEPIEPGETAVIAAVEGLTLHVRRLSRGDSDDPEAHGLGRRQDERGHLSPAHRYDRLAPFYDLLDAPMDRSGGKQRRVRVLAVSRGRGSRSGSVPAATSVSTFPTSTSRGSTFRTGRLPGRAHATTGSSASTRRFESSSFAGGEAATSDLTGPAGAAACSRGPAYRALSPRGPASSCPSAAACCGAAAWPRGGW